MNRWGVEPSEVGEARKILGPQLAGVYTHFASADSDEEATKRQIDCFDSVLAAQPFGGVLVHAANSAATLWHPRSHYDSSVPASRSTACTRRVIRETRPQRTCGPRWRSRATSPTCGGSLPETGCLTG